MSINQSSGPESIRRGGINTTARLIPKPRDAGGWYVSSDVEQRCRAAFLKAQVAELAVSYEVAADAALSPRERREYQMMAELFRM